MKRIFLEDNKKPKKVRNMKYIYQEKVVEYRLLQKISPTLAKIKWYKGLL